MNTTTCDNDDNHGNENMIVDEHQRLLDAIEDDIEAAKRSLLRDVEAAAAAEDEKDTISTTAATEGRNVKGVVDPDLLQRVTEYVAKHRPVLILLTPTYGFSCNVDFVICLTNTLALMRQMEVETVVEFCKNDSLVPRARNNLVAKALARPEQVTHLMFVDSDIVWNPWDVLKLLVSDKELIGGVYPKKKYNLEKILDPSFPQQVLEHKRQSILKDMDDLAYVKCKLVDCNLNYLSERVEIINNLCEVRHIATGFMMIRRSLLEELKTQFPHMKYEDDCGFLDETEQQHAFGFFNTEISNRHFMSEDWYFCDLCKKIDKQVFVDVSINLCHVGTEYYSGSLLASLI